ncbi:MAG: DUF460 domain-containing protein [Candidatus Helarchaeota archaeon]|nr:DUF460 domain-containing protein [Candidatus Helarchaeota archaeon]
MPMLSKVIMGIDILPMSSSSSKRKPKYAAIIFKEEKIIFKDEEITLRKLNKVLTKYKPDILATDNIWELAPTQESLQNLMKQFPPFKLVQVTGSPSQGMQPVHKLARRCGIHLTSHPTPIETAEICVRLVQIGIGFEVALFEKETQIRISRTRNIGPGGWSQNRYRRHSHAVILQSTRDIQTQLDEQGIEYDLSVRKADYGLDKSVFTVYAAVSDILSFIKSYNGSTIQIKVTPIKKKEMEFIPLTAQEDESPPLKSLIVGVDPGTTTGIAILDLNGKILALRSGKDISRRDLIRYIAKLGSAVMICSDVSPLPKYVEKVANTFNSIIFRPRKSLKVSEKQELVNNYLQNSKRKVSDAHIRDSLACALKAYFSYQNIFEKIQKRIREMNVDVPLEKVKVLVMRGYSIYDAISILTFKPEEKEEETILEQTQHTDTDRVKELNEKIYLLIDKNLQLKRNFDDLHTKNVKLEEELELQRIKISESQERLETVRSKSFYRLRGERLIRAQEKEINHLRKVISELKDQITTLENQISKLERKSVILEELERQRLANKIIILKVVENFSKECLESVELFPNDVIYMLDGSGGGSSTAEQLINNEISAIITNTLSHNAYEQFKNSGIYVIPTEEIQKDLKIRAGIYYLDKKIFDQKLKMYKQRQHEMSRQEAESWLQNLVSDYRKRKDTS